MRVRTRRRSWRPWAAAILVTTPLGFAPAQTHAYVPMYTLARMTIPGDGSVVARWNPCQVAVTYRVNATLAASTSAGRAAAIADIKAAVNAITVATGVKFRYLGTTSRIPRGLLWWQHLGDAEIIIAWVDQSVAWRRSDLLQRSSRGWLAGTGGWEAWSWSGGPGRGSGAAIVRGFVVLNAAQRGYFKPDYSAGITRGELLLHELGHVVGLNHVPYSSQMMYPYLLARASTKYASGDLTGLKLLGRTAGCLAIPAWASAPADLPTAGAIELLPLPPPLHAFEELLRPGFTEAGITAVTLVAPHSK